MTMKSVHALWHAIVQCYVATENCEEEGRPFCKWSLSCAGRAPCRITA